MFEIGNIGIVKSRYIEPTDPFEMRKAESFIEIYEEFSEGLYDIESNRYLQILFYFNRSVSYKLKRSWYHGDEKGVFACRSPNRPVPIGLTTVELIERKGRILRVRGLDALDESPVLDIKPYIPRVDNPDGTETVSRAFLEMYPRSSLTSLIKNREMTPLLLETGKLHGHFCPGSALGVAATVYGLHGLADKLGTSVASLQSSGGMEELLAIIEINSCFADGVQFVSGCTLGNNGLIYRDLGKTAVSFCTRSGIGIRVAVKSSYSDVIENTDSQFYPLFKKCVVDHSRDPELLREFKQSARRVSFKLVETDPKNLFNLIETELSLPDYAPIRETLVCESCREPVMGGKLSEKIDGSSTLCKACAHTVCRVLDGSGLGEELL